MKTLAQHQEEVFQLRKKLRAVKTIGEENEIVLTFFADDCLERELKINYVNYTAPLLEVLGLEDDGDRATLLIESMRRMLIDGFYAGYFRELLRGQNPEPEGEHHE